MTNLSTIALSTIPTVYRGYSTEQLRDRLVGYRQERDRLQQQAAEHLADLPSGDRVADWALDHAHMAALVDSVARLIDAIQMELDARSGLD